MSRRSGKPAISAPPSRYASSDPARHPRRLRGDEASRTKASARRYADLAVKARAAGKGFPTPDGYIAAIAAAHEFAVASRDTSAFTIAGLTVIDPWSAAAR